MSAQSAAVGTRFQAISALRHRNYRLYWLSGLGQAMAVGMQFLILGWLVLQLTNSASQLGLVIFLYGLPNLSMLLFGGIFADRVDRRLMLVYSQMAVTALVLLAATLTLLQLISIWHIYGIALVLGVIQGINMPARISIVADLVPREDILNATSLNMAVFNTGRIIGPSIAGGIIDYVGLGHALFINAALYAMGVLFLLMMSGVPSKTARNHGNLLIGLWEGVRYTAVTPIAYSLVGLSFAFGFFGAAYIQVLPAFAKDVLRVNASGAGWLISASGIGSLFGSMYMASLGNTRHKSALLIGMITLFGVMLFFYSLSPIYVLSFIILLIAGIGFTGFISMGTTIFQLSTPMELRGRMMSQWLVGAATQFVGAFPISLAAEYLGWHTAMAGSALMMLAMVFWLGIYRPTFRQLKL
ncbi:MAG: hypothetical protein BZY79_00630 [SAR202 cluster bacterium Casp-Chloro-G4]|nr:MFS transporter [Chloroflexota bacterium]MDA1228145.1 MFS transporter [Chloroflexota bacterium]PKB62044.1 MAG: hypothetical protein BZY79_00630 [SAR202 cluster bacterium Casp-Chloro-G4]